MYVNYFTNFPLISYLPFVLLQVSLFPLQKNSLFCICSPLICINLPSLAFSLHPSNQHNSLKFTNASMLSNPRAHSLFSTPLLSYHHWTQWIFSTGNIVDYTTWLWDNIFSSFLLACGQLLHLLLLRCLSLVSPPEADWSWSLLQLSWIFLILMDPFQNFVFDLYL